MSLVSFWSKSLRHAKAGPNFFSVWLGLLDSADLVYKLGNGYFE